MDDTWVASYAVFIDQAPASARALQPNISLFKRVTIAAGIHLFPFRTEKLSPPAPMVLRGLLVGE